MGVISTAKVVTGAERSNRPVSIQPGNREWVTVIDCISSYGWSLLSVIIFEGKVHQSTWYTEALPLDWTIGVSENGWTDDRLGLIWPQNVFEKHTAHRTKGNYRLLILDGMAVTSLQSLTYSARNIQLLHYTCHCILLAVVCT
jgi:hypothetical protein